MFEYIKGTIEYIAEDYIVIENNNIGYKLFVSGITLTNLNLHDMTTIFIYMNVREDDISLFGFMNRDELSAFKLLISVSGIGPKGALSVLSIMTVNELRLAVLSDDSKAISKANGIGPKTASRVVMELKDKFKLDNIFDEYDNYDNLPDLSSNDIITETALALEALGYSQMDSIKAIKKVEGYETMTVEVLLKSALKKIM